MGNWHYLTLHCPQSSTLNSTYSAAKPKPKTKAENQHEAKANINQSFGIFLNELCASMVTGRGMRGGGNSLATLEMPQTQREREKPMPSEGRNEVKIKRK